MNSDNRLIVALDVPDAINGMDIVKKLGDSVSFYKIGLGMLTGGGMALANELKQDLNKKVFMDLKLFDIGATIERAVKGLTQYDIDFLTVNGDPQVVRAAIDGKGVKDTKILAVTFLTSLDRKDLTNNLYKKIRIKIRKLLLKQIITEAAILKNGFQKLNVPEVWVVVAEF